MKTPKLRKGKKPAPDSWWWNQNINQYPEINICEKRETSVWADFYDPTNQNNEKQKTNCLLAPYLYFQVQLNWSFYSISTSPYSELLTKHFFSMLFCLWSLHPDKLHALLADIVRQDRGCSEVDVVHKGKEKGGGPWWEKHGTSIQKRSGFKSQLHHLLAVWHCAPNSSPFPHLRVETLLSFCQVCSE